MTFRILTDLSSWTTECLMLSLRRQFAYSVGILVLMVSLLFGMFITEEIYSQRQHMMYSIIMFSVFELCIWLAFIRHWRELKRRQILINNGRGFIDSAPKPLIVGN